MRLPWMASACRNRSKVIALTLSRAGREPLGKQVKSQLIAVIVYNYLYLFFKYILYF